MKQNLSPTNLVKAYRNCYDNNQLDQLQISLDNGLDVSIFQMQAHRHQLERQSHETESFH